MGWIKGLKRPFIDKFPTTKDLKEPWEPWNVKKQKHVGKKKYFKIRKKKAIFRGEDRPYMTFAVDRALKTNDPSTYLGEGPRWQDDVHNAVVQLPQVHQPLAVVVNGQRHFLCRQRRREDGPGLSLLTLEN